MIPNMNAEQFLRQHLGHTWHGISYDEIDYGRLGEPISIEPAYRDNMVNGFQSTLLSDAVATEISARLGTMGILNPRDFTRVGVGNDGTEAVTLVFKKEAMERVMSNEALLEATLDKPLIGTTGKEYFAATHHPDAAKRPEVSSPTAQALGYLNDIAGSYVKGAKWRKLGSEFVLFDTDENKLDAVQGALTEQGIAAQYVPGGNPDVAGGDSEPANAELRVPAQTLLQKLGMATPNERSR